MPSSLVNEQTPLADEQRDALESMLKSGHVAGVTSVHWIETLGRSSIKARFMKPGKYSHVTWLGGNKAKY